MVAFAANSVLGRLGLIEGDIDAGLFAVIRLFSGAIMLTLIVAIRRQTPSGTWRGGLALLTYAAFFSYAYIALPAGTGAVILFAVVQITMLGYGLYRGERLGAVQWAGVAIAMAALVWLVSPGLGAPHPIGALAMAIAGIGWGVYSLLGRLAGDPTRMTAGNFIRAAIIALPLFLMSPIFSAISPLFTASQTVGTYGVVLAIISGAVTSGLGYAVWYTALKDLTATRASVAQLTVPAIAALGGVLFLAEPITVRFTLASLAILGGVALTTLTAPPHPRKSQ